MDKLQVHATREHLNKKSSERKTLGDARQRSYILAAINEGSINRASDSLLFEQPSAVARDYWAERYRFSVAQGVALCPLAPNGAARPSNGSAQSAIATSPPRISIS